MCKEDVRIKRKVYAQPTVTRNVVGATASFVLPPNPNRAAVLVAMEDGDVASTLTVRVRSESLTGPMLGLLSIFNPSVLFTLEEQGNAITTAIWVEPRTFTNQNMFVVEYTWLEDLEKL